MPAPISDGLGLLDFSLAPHYRSEHYAAPAIERIVDYFRANWCRTGRCATGR